MDKPMSSKSNEPRGPLQVLSRTPRSKEEVHGTSCSVADLFEYIEVFYNRVRRHCTLGSRSPILFMQDWIAARDRAGKAA